MSEINKNKNVRLAYKLSEAAELLSVPASTLRKRIREGEINAVTTLGPWLITRKEIDRVLECTLRPSNGKGQK
jgi:excisionase family DNA binding protein